MSQDTFDLAIATAAEYERTVARLIREREAHAASTVDGEGREHPGTHAAHWWPMFRRTNQH